MVFAQLSAPLSLSSSPPYDGEVNLQWTPIASPTTTVEAYVIWRQFQMTCSPTATPMGTLTPTVSPTPIATVEADSLPQFGTPDYQDSQVTNGQTYSYQVAGIDSSGNVGQAATITVVPFANPSAVQPVTVENIHSNTLDVFWNVPASSLPISFYTVYRYAYPTSTPTSTPLAPTNVPTLNLTASSTPTDTPTSTLSPTPMPAQTVLSSNTLVATVCSTQFADSPPVPGGEVGFCYVVMATDSNGNLSAQPTYASNSGLPQNMAPPAPPVLTGLVAVTMTPTIIPNGYGVRLVWTGGLLSEGVSLYQVLQNGTPIATINYSTPTPTMTYDDITIPLSSNAAVSTNYNIVAFNNNGPTTSNLVSETILAAQASNPIQVTPNPTNNSVTVSWNPGTAGTYGLLGYWVFKSVEGVPSPIIPLVGTITPTTTPSPSPTSSPTAFATIQFTPSVLPTLVVVDTPITNHEGYWIVPFDNTKNGNSLGTAATPILNLAPTPPSNVNVSAPINNNQVTISWQEGAPGFYGTEQNYIVFRDIITSGITPTPTIVGRISAAATTLEITNSFSVPVSTNVGYQVGLTDSFGNLSDLSPLSNIVAPVSLVAPNAPKILPFTGTASYIEFSWYINPQADQVDSYFIYGPPYPATAVIGTLSPTAIYTATCSPTLTPGYVIPFAPNLTPTPWVPIYYYVLAHNVQGLSQPATLSGIPVPAYQVTAVITPNSNQVGVTWSLVPPAGITATPGVDSYGIYRSRVAGSKFTPLATVPLTTSSYTDILPTATAGVSYYYLVTARAGGAVSQLAESPLNFQGVPNPEGSVQTVPNIPTGLTACSLPFETTLYWAGNAPQESVSYYSIYLDGTLTPINTVSATQSPTPTYGFVATEIPGNLSYYQVSAQNASGSSGLSNPVSVLVPPAVTPIFALTPPTFVSPTPNSTPPYPESVWISGLTYSNAVSGYTINRLSLPTPSTTPTYVPIGSVSIPVSYYGDSSAVPGYINNYQVVASSSLGISANPAISASMAVTVWPASPNFSITGNASAISLICSTPVGNTVPVTNYSFFRSFFSSVTPTPIATNTSGTYIDIMVTPGVPYVYWASDQASSGSSTLTAPQTIIPCQPVSLSITPLTDGSGLVWTPVTVTQPNNQPNTFTGYMVYRAIATPGVLPTFTTLGNIVEGLSNTTTSDLNLTGGVSYIYEVAPSTQNNILGPFSNQVAVTVYPLPVTNLVAPSGDGYVQLNWNYGGSTTSSYLIQKKLGTASLQAYQNIVTVGQGVYDYQDNNVVDKNYYDYRVYTIDSTGLTSTAYAFVMGFPAAPGCIKCRCQLKSKRQ